MTKPLLLLPPRATQDSILAWQAALSMGWSTLRVHGWRLQEDPLKTHETVVIYGEPLFVEALADQLDLALLEPPLDWLLSLPQPFTNRRLSFTSISTARKLAGPLFIKPADGKVFPPRVFASGSELPAENAIPENIPVLISEPVTWLLEVRCFVENRRIVALSPYWRDGRSAQAHDGTWPFRESEEEQARAFAAKILENPSVPLPPAAVLDIGITRESGWSVIEANPIWGSGLYGAGPCAVLEAIRSAILPSINLSQEMKVWVNSRTASAES